MNAAITREQVHFIGESCSSDDTFDATATRLIKDQRRLSRFFEQNAEPMGLVAGQVSLYMLSVCIRIFEQAGGRLRKVSGDAIIAARKRVQPMLPALMPADEDFAERAKAIVTRAQPHILDEVLWALYTRPQETDEQADLEPNQKALVYIMLWTAVEALDAAWTPSKGWTPENFVLPEGAEGPPEA